MSDNKLRVALINPQGHVRWNNPPIARHPDTGGQIVYILELSMELARLGCEVDIFTRCFDDPTWPGYSEKFEEHPELDNLRIIRVKCGPAEFLNKEELWPYIREFADGIADYYKSMDQRPGIMTSHYADAGLAAAMLKKNLSVSYTHTGHSLGGKKIDNLKITSQNFRKINSGFKFAKRIASERVAFRNAASIVTSTKEEIKKQYGHRVYRGAVRNPNKFRIIPPGIDPSHFFPFWEDEKNPDIYNAAVKKLTSEIDKSIGPERRDLPFIFSAARFDAKKNPSGLLKAYASSRLLRNEFNLMIIAGSVEDPLRKENRKKFKRNEQLIIDRLSSLIKENSLSGSVVFSPGFDFRAGMPCVYRYAGRHGWIFVNPALHEPFGLTIVEAMASGLPVVATMHGGPSEILDGGRYGVLADSCSSDSLRAGIEKLADKEGWNEFSRKGVKRVLERFTWASAAEGYKELFQKIISRGISFDNDYEIPEWFARPFITSDSVIVEELKRLYFTEHKREEI